MGLSFQSIHPKLAKSQSDMAIEMMNLPPPKVKLETSLVDKFPSLYDIPTYTFIGSFAWTSNQGGWKLIQAKNAMQVGEGWKTPADVARDYIRAKYEKPGRITSKQYLNIMKHRQAPLYANPGKYSDAVYLDLKSAYWSILQIVGWDVDYMPERWIARSSDVRDFPYWRNKLARNCLVSVGLKGDGRAWNGKELVVHKKQNPYTNMMLWACVQDVLNGIAKEMISAGAVYVHTDGYILPQNAIDRGMQIINEWGMVASVRQQGDMEVIAAGTYSMPGKPNNRLVTTRPIAHNGVGDVNVGWLKRRFSILSETTNLILG